jgi:hypothetical protein
MKTATEQLQNRLNELVEEKNLTCDLTVTNLDDRKTLPDGDVVVEEKTIEPDWDNLLATIHFDGIEVPLEFKLKTDGSTVETIAQFLLTQVEYWQ